MLPIVDTGPDDAGDFLCVRCSRRQKTCCQTCDIYTTTNDVERIRSHIGHGDFTEYRGVSDPVYLDQDDDPLWRDAVFGDGDTRRVLKKQENGDCTFLGEAGCTLPLEIRPLVCRIFPFDYTEAGLRDELAGGCPTYLLPPGVGLVTALDMHRADAQRWHAQLYGDLREELAARRVADDDRRQDKPR